MRRALSILGVLATLFAAGAAAAGGYSRVYLVPALKQCLGFASCVPREFESAYTFDTIVLRSPATKYSPSGKPSLILEIHGVRDPAGALANGTLTLRVISGRVSLPTLGTFPDGAVPVAPAAVPLKNGNARYAYKPSDTIPHGLITNGGGVEVLDPDGNLLAVTGSQSKP